MGLSNVLNLICQAIVTWYLLKDKKYSHDFLHLVTMKGLTINLTCETLGKEIQWKLNGKPSLPINTKNESFSIAEKFHHVLTIVEIEEQNDGAYSCHRTEKGNLVVGKHEDLTS